MSTLKIGYARVSTDAQDLTAQRDALGALGVEGDRLYVDQHRNRPGLRQALAACRGGDELVVTKLDRLARSLPDARDTWRVLSREPMLASRVYRRVRFQPLSRTHVLAAIPAYHPLYAHADPELIHLIDDLFAHGNLRNWAAFTDSALRLARDVDRDELDEPLTRNVFALHGGADR